MLDLVNGAPRLVLASASPRRRELLTAAGIAFELRPTAVEEIRRPGEAPRAYVARLAAEKALAALASDDEIVLGADTTVVIGDEILEKPRDSADARRMLALLSGKEHEVMTGICLRQGRRTSSAVETTQVRFSVIPPGEIDAYASTAEPMDKAGAYAIQGLASRWVERVDGCYFNVVGLPVSRLWRELRQFLSD